MRILFVFSFSLLLGFSSFAQTVITDSTSFGVVKIFRQDVDFYNVLDTTAALKLNQRMKAVNSVAFEPFGTTINYFLKVRVDRSNRETAIAKLVRSYDYYGKQYRNLKKHSNSSLNQTIIESVKGFNKLLNTPKKPQKFYVVVGSFGGGIADFRSDIIIPLEVLTYPKTDTISFADSTLINAAINEKLLGYFLTEQIARPHVSDPNDFSIQKLNPFSSKGFISVSKIFSFFGSSEKKVQSFNFGNNNLADAMIKSGISHYIAKRANPDEFQLIQKRLSFDVKKQNTNDLWKKLVDKLSNKDEATKLFYTTMESTAGKSEYMLGTYFGLLIVDDYMTKTKSSIDELLDESDYQKIFEQSGWKEKTENL